MEGDNWKVLDLGAEKFLGQVGRERKQRESEREE